MMIMLFIMPHSSLLFYYTSPGYSFSFPFSTPFYRLSPLPSISILQQQTTHNCKLARSPMIFSSVEIRWRRSFISSRKYTSRLLSNSFPELITCCISNFKSPDASLNMSSKYAYNCMHSVNRSSPIFCFSISLSSSPVMPFH